MLFFGLLFYKNTDIPRLHGRRRPKAGILKFNFASVLISCQVSFQISFRDWFVLWSEKLSLHSKSRVGWSKLHSGHCSGSSSSNRGGWRVVHVTGAASWFSSTRYTILSSGEPLILGFRCKSSRVKSCIANRKTMMILLSSYYTTNRTEHIQSGQVY